MKKIHILVFTVLFASSVLLMSAPASATVVYSQNDSRWARYKWKYNAVRGSSPLVESGCGPTSIAIVVRSLTDAKVTPKSIAKKYTKYHSVNGIEHRAFERVYSDYGLHGRKLGSLDEAASFLDSNKVSQTSKGSYVIMATSGGLTGGGHIVVLTRYKNGKFKLLDPKYSSNSRYWSRSDFRDRNVGIIGYWGYTERRVSPRMQP